MSHPVIHAEIRSQDPDATRAFFSELFGWQYSEGAFPGYTFVDPGIEGALPTAIGPLQGGADSVLFFVGVEDVEATLARAEQLGGKTIQPAPTSAGCDLRRVRRRPRPHRRGGRELTPQTSPGAGCGCRPNLRPIASTTTGGSRAMWFVRRDGVNVNVFLVAVGGGRAVLQRRAGAGGGTRTASRCSRSGRGRRT
jgi:uncharacterized protein